MKIRALLALLAPGLLFTSTLTASAATDCSGYSVLAQRMGVINKDLKCGYTGSRYSMNTMDHWLWCEKNRETGFPEAEARIRELEIAACKDKQAKATAPATTTTTTTTTNDPAPIKSTERIKSPVDVHEEADGDSDILGIARPGDKVIGFKCSNTMDGWCNIIAEIEGGKIKVNGYIWGDFLKR